MLTQHVSGTLPGGDQQHKCYHVLMVLFPKPIPFSIPQAKSFSPGFAHSKYPLPDGDLLKFSTISTQLGLTTTSLHPLHRQV